MERNHVEGWRCRAEVALLMAAALMAGPARAQQPTGHTIRIDHAVRRAYVQDHGNRDPVRTGGQIRVPSPYRVRIVAENTNSALYACSLTATPAPVPELDSLRAFLTALGPYVPAVLMDRLGVQGLGKADTLKVALQRLDSLITGPQGLQWILRQTLQALDTLRFEGGKSIGDRAQATLGTLGQACNRTGCRPLISRILAADSAVAKGVAELQGQVVTGEAAKLKDSLLTVGRGVLGDQDKVMATAYAVETLVHAVVNASDSVVCDTVEFPGNEGRDLTITVAPRQTAELARLADRKTYELKVTVLPQWSWRPAVGLALLYAVDATYPTYGTTTTPNVSVLQTGTKDYRAMYGLTLGLTYRGIDGRDSKSGLTWWLPEVTIVPTEDLRAFGIGTAISCGIVKLGVGALWVKHDVLDGVSVGDVLSDAAKFRTKPVFGEAGLYISLSVIGWQPFVRSAK